MKCANCGVEVEIGAKFCGECGAPIPQEKECPNCHVKWPVKAKFCGDCGYNFSTGSMSAAGAMLGSGNAIAGDIVHNTNVCNSGNISNVVVNNVSNSVVNNISDINIKGCRGKLTVVFEGETLACGFSRYGSFKELLSVPGPERKRLSSPENCASKFSGYVLYDCKMSVLEERADGYRVKHEIKIDSADFYDDATSDTLMITADTKKEFDFGPEGDAAYLLAFERKKSARYVGTVDLQTDFNPAALKVEGRKNIWSNYHLGTRIVYAGQEIRMTCQGAAEDAPRKLIAWKSDEYWDLDADSDDDAWLADITVEGVSIKIARKVFSSEADFSDVDHLQYEKEFLDPEEDLFDDLDTCFLVGKSKVTITDRFSGETESAPINADFAGLELEDAPRYFDAPDYACGAVELYMSAERKGSQKYSEICYGAFGISHINFSCSKIEYAKGGLQYGLTVPMLDWEDIESIDDEFDDFGIVSAWTISSKGIIDFWDSHDEESVDEFIERYLSVRDLSKRPSFGTEIDRDMFVAVLKVANAESGGWLRVKAQLIVGDCYFADDGKGVVEHDNKLAFDYYYKSMCGEYAPAMIMLGICYEQGLGVAKDNWHAHQIYARAARGGSKDAVFVITDKCKGCTMCKRKCPKQAISGVVKQVHVMDRTLCTNCGVCEDTCKFHAVIGELCERLHNHS